MWRRGIMYRQASQGTCLSKIRQNAGKFIYVEMFQNWPIIFLVHFFPFFAEGRTLPMERRHQVLENGTLIINKVTRKDKGLYSCTATNRQGNSASQSGQLKVIGEFFPLEVVFWEKANNVMTLITICLRCWVPRKKGAALLVGIYSELIMERPNWLST